MPPYDLTQLTEYSQRVRKRLPGGVHYNFRLPWEETPIHFARGQNSRLWDLDGNEYVDFYARFGAMIVGHNNAEYTEALKQMIDRTLLVSHCEIDEETLELIAKHVPSAEMIRFGTSGTEMVQIALRLARAYTKKNRFVRFSGHFHGSADNIMGGKAPRVGPPIPKDYLGDFKGTDGRAFDALESQSFLLPWNDPDALEEIVETYGDEIAAIITEPVCVNGGGIMPRPGYLEAMRTLCDRHHIVLIFDEMITGFRVGLGGAQGLFGVTPDLTTLGKALAGGGVPVAALVGRRSIMQMLVDKKVVHAGTFNGYPLGMAAVKATLEILQKDDGAALAAMGGTMDRIHAALVAEAARFEIPLVIQGPSNCASFHCTDKILENSDEYSYDIMLKDILLNNALSKYGVLISVISRMYPNITLNDSDVEFVRDRITSAMMDTKQIFEEIYETK
jgi:glutamate-1-semialdehyde 2,1-aminomutase